MMQRSFIDAVSRPRDDGDTPVGFLFVTDDVLINTGVCALVYMTMCRTVQQPKNVFILCCRDIREG